MLNTSHTLRVSDELYDLLKRVEGATSLSRGEIIRRCFRWYQRISSVNPVVIIEIEDVNTGSGSIVCKFEAPEKLVPEGHDLQRFIIGLRLSQVDTNPIKHKIPKSDRKYQGIAEMARLST